MAGNILSPQRDTLIRYGFEPASLEGIFQSNYDNVTITTMIIAGNTVCIHQQAEFDSGLECEQTVFRVNRLKVSSDEELLFLLKLVFN